MSEESVLDAARALREFTTGQLAAYCSEDPRRVEEVLRSRPDRIEWLGDGRRPEGGTAGRWRVAERPYTRVVPVTSAIRGVRMRP